MTPDRDLFANFDRVRREIDELFGDVFGRTALAPHRRAGFTPSVDVSSRRMPGSAAVTTACGGLSW